MLSGYLKARMKNPTKQVLLLIKIKPASQPFAIPLLESARGEVPNERMDGGGRMRPEL